MRRNDRDAAIDETDDVGSAGRMSFLEHLEELRKRLLWAVASVGVGFAITIVFIDRIFAFIVRPMQQLLPDGQKLIYTDPSEAFLLQIKIALIVIAASVLSPDGGGIGMVVMSGPVILLYVLSIGLAWAFGKKRTAETEARQSEHALVFLITADWLRRKCIAMLSNRTVTHALRS